MDDVLCDFTGQFKKDALLNPKIGFPQSQYGFFAKLQPINGAIEAVKTLYYSEKYQPYILTAPSTRNPLCYTEKRVWVEENLGMEFVQRLIICPNKSLLKGALLIDDNDLGKGQEEFEGELLHFGSERYPDWASIRERLDI
jgi:5'(3')-deoxyribonucleotidase